MRRFRLLVEYDGTDYAGFQTQESDGLRTIQAELEKAIRRKGGETRRVSAAGRTDAGVHATGQVVHFDTGWRIPAERLVWALNGDLPPDIRVRDAVEVDETFHARFSATAREYRYTILNRESPSALAARFTWNVRFPLDIEAMADAARELTGTHDFAAFGAPDLPGKSTVRHVHKIGIVRRGELVRIGVRGNAFLRQQVRALVGVLEQVGLGKLDREGVAKVRDSRDRTKAPAIAPAQGLTLTRVDYSGTRMAGANLFLTTGANTETDADAEPDAE